MRINLKNTYLLLLKLKKYDFVNAELNVFSKPKLLFSTVALFFNPFNFLIKSKS